MENKVIVGAYVETAMQAAALFCDVAKMAGEQEGFYVLPLDGGGKVLAEPIIVSLGYREGVAAVDQKEVFKAAFKVGADAIIVAHNHPSGVLKPSKADLHLTEELKSRAEWLGLEFIDHIILASTDSAKGFDFVSLAEGVL